jgi:hypothetical protein
VLGFLHAGDVLMVARIDRLARSIGDLRDIVRAVRARGAVPKATEQPIDIGAAARCQQHIRPEPWRRLGASRETAFSTQMAIRRPISTTWSVGSLKYSVSWEALRSIAANSTSCQRGRPLPS